MSNAQAAPRPLAGRIADGTVIASGAFRVIAYSGEDLAGEVYRGEALSGPSGAAEKAAVSIKLLAEELRQAAGERLAVDVAVVARMEHKNLLRVFGLYPHGEHVLLCGEAPAGQSLRQMIDKKRQSQGQPLSLKGAYNIIANVCNLLTYAHGALPHGALCPELVDIALTGQVRIGELAIGRFVSPERLARCLPRSAAYLAPERLRGEGATAAADIYAIGVLLLECLTTESPERAVEKRATELNPELPPLLDEVIGQCLLPDPARRWSSPQLLKEAIADAIAGGPKATSRPLAVYSAAASPSQPKVSEQMPAVIAPPQPPTGAAPDPVTPPAGAPLPAGRPDRQPPITPAPVAAGPGGQATIMAHTPAKGAPIIPLPGSTSGPGGPPRAPFSPQAPPGSSGARPLVPGLPGTSGQRPQVPGTSGQRAAVDVDDDHERWLITKEDKMDYGPFPLREVRSQIEKGTVSADHLITDTETGDRRRIREHPLLADMSREWEGRHAQAQMELRDQTERARHRASVQKLLSGIFIVMLLIGGGVGGYFKFVYKPEVKTVVVKEASGDDFFKGVEIAMKVDPPKPKVKGTGKKRVLRNGKWEEVTNLGDAGEEGGDETLSGEQVQGVMNKNFKVLGGCLKEEATRNPAVKRLDLDFQIRGNGVVSAVKVNGEATSTVASCVFQKMQSVIFPKFNGAKTHASFSLSLK